MKNEILANIHKPDQLEKLYRSDKPAFKQAFNALQPELKDETIVGFWNARLNYTREEISGSTGNDLTFVITISAVAGIISLLPVLLHLNKEFFYTRNIGFIVFPALCACFVRKNKLSVGKIAFIAIAVLVGVFFINALPDVKKSDTTILSCIHLALVLWAILGFTFVGGPRNNVEQRLGYLRYNGDLVVMTALIVIAGVILTVVTVGLFSLIGINIKDLYFDNIVPFLLPAAPILGTWLTQTNPQLVGKVSPVIARIFSPLVLAMLIIYLIAIVYSGNNPYNDRQFLLVFNALLIGVMAIIFFSVAESAKSIRNIAGNWILFLLSVVTIIVNGIALSAIIFRIAEWGITPNRAAVLGSNLLMLINLALVTVQLFRSVRKNDMTGVGTVISGYLPVYFLWAIIVTFIFPLLFGFR